MLMFQVSSFKFQETIDDFHYENLNWSVNQSSAIISLEVIYQRTEVEQWYNYFLFNLNCRLKNKSKIIISQHNYYIFMDQISLYYSGSQTVLREPLVVGNLLSGVKTKYLADFPFYLRFILHLTHCRRFAYGLPPLKE